MDGCRAKLLQFGIFRITCGGATKRERDGRVGIFNHGLDGIAAGLVRST